MCGIFGVFNSERAAVYTHAGLFALQHRGREGAGIAIYNGEKIKVDKHLGLVQEIWPDEKSLEGLEGKIAIGGNRYSTVRDEYGPECTQPFNFTLEDDREIATVHNGNITNYEFLRAELQAKKAVFTTKIDSEIFGFLINHAEGDTIQGKIKNSFSEIVGAYSVIIMRDDELIGVRDPWGFRPLEVAKIDSAYVLASETCAFDILREEKEADVEELGPVEPGGIVTINKTGIKYDSLPNTTKLAPCIFEYVYFSRPDSRTEGVDVDKIRKGFGRTLAKEHPAPGAEVVVSVPDSGNSAAIGYSQESGIPYDIGIIRNHHTGRTFILNTNIARKKGVARKFNPVKSIVQGKSLVVVDDSIVRGNTSKGVAEMLWGAGARELHWRVSSPPIINPCFYGIDMKTNEELLVNSLSIKDVSNIDELQQIAAHLGVNSIGYLSPKGMMEAVPGKSYCRACFQDGSYPTPLQF
ncbi:MAG: amidophosphoribosyltransferase [Nanoarchaeota archaeon]|nr:amidophosphoribosyltransferase [DPANN group archaeon]MBL7116329.1 amidophosphoribosyltransferase [Nanoarchaeota archaeon]